jgi:hypothetical protein
MEYTSPISTASKVSAKKRKNEVREPRVSLMLRPKLSQKVCAEQVAKQIGIKRSQLDPNFYLAGALLVGVERLGKAESIGTWTRKEVAVFLKSTFLPLFELLYEQEELPLVFNLLLAQGVPLTAVQQPLAAGQVQPSSLGQTAAGSAAQQEQPPVAKAEAYVPLLSMDAEVGLDGFPGGI